MHRSAQTLRGDRGSVSLLVVLLLPALILAAGLVLDGGRQVQARREAHGVAAAAARAGIQMSPDEVFAEALDPGRASGRAYAALAAQGASGSVSVSGNQVTVVVSAGVDYAILPGAGSVRQEATADARRGVNAGSP